MKLSDALLDAFLAAGHDVEKASDLANRIEGCVLAKCDEAAARHGLIARGAVNLPEHAEGVVDQSRQQLE